MMLAKRCDCPNPRVFEESDTCHRCGHDSRRRITDTTGRLAWAIAEVMLGYRRLTDRTRRIK